MKRKVAFATALLLTACAGPKHAPPPDAAIYPPAKWRTAANTGTEIDATWWQNFNDPALSALVESALQQNVDIAIAAGRVTEARAQFNLARAQRLPNVTGIAAGGRSRDINAFGVPKDQTAGEAELSASFDLDLFGRLAKAAAAARASLVATSAAKDSVRLAVATGAASGYIALRGLDARLMILRNTLVARGESLKLARRRTQTGYTTNLDLRQAEAEYYATEQLIPAAELAIRQQENALSILLGQNPSAITRGAELQEIALPPVPPSLPSDLLRKRPDITQAEQQLVAADRSLDSARAAFMPTFSLTASGGYVGSTLLPDNPIGIFSAGGSILAPILDSGRLRAQEHIAEARRDQAAFAYRKAVLSAYRDVEDALAALERLKEQEQSVAAQRDAAAHALTIATNRYRAGYSPYLEQLDAERTLLSVELSLAQVRTSRLIVTVSLYQALGGGWKTPI